MPFWTYQNLAKVTAGTWLVAPPPEVGNATIPAALRDAGPILWHDTREIQPGQVYLAIAGENFDGNRFVPQAFAAGAALAIVDSREAVSDQLSAFSQNQQPVLRVDDSVKALQQLARAYRAELTSGGCKVIGIAGSNGKTTTRHLIHHVLTHAGKTGTQSPKSFNNHLGVPLTLLAARPADDFVACEIGTNHPGEIDFLSEIAKPDIAVITSIGEEHLEFFKTVRGVAEEESAILNHVVEDGLIVCPEHDWQRYLKRYYARDSVQVAHGWYTPESEAAESRLWELPDYLRSNVALAGFVALSLGVPHDLIDQAVRKMDTPPGRAETITFDQVVVIHDAYNANPSSVRAALSGLDAFDAERRVLVFGDMYELGEHAAAAHVTVGIQAETYDFDLMVCIGPLAKLAVGGTERMPTHVFDEWTDRTPGDVADLLQPGDTVLLKASRGMRLERLIPAIEKRFGKAQG